MRRFYQVSLRLTLILASFVFLTPDVVGQQSAGYSEVFTTRRAGQRIASGLQTGYHQISWTTSPGTPPGACLIGLDYSDDGMVWNLGSPIPEHDCTSDGGTVAIGPQHVNFVRLDVTSLTPSVAIRATYAGFQTNPGPSGTVTSVFGRTGQVLAQPGDFTVTQITGAAPLFSPAFSGLPTAPTPASSDNSNAIATTAWVTQFIGTPGGGGGNATGLAFGSTNIPMSTTVPTAGQCLSYNGTSISGAACGGAGGGLGGSGTVNTLPKFVTNSTTLGDSLLSDNGTTLTYTGTGGISAPQITATGTGGFLLTSATAAVPSSPPGAGQNALVSGPNGWYVANANGPWIGPIGVGGGGGTPQPITMSPDQAPICASQTTTTATLTISPLNIQPGDTVMVGTLISQPSGQTNYVGVTDPSGGNTFTSLRDDASSNPGFASTNGPRVAIFATAPGGALLTNSVVVTRLTANAVNFVGCVAVYRHVTGFGPTPTATGAASGAASGTISQTLTQPNNFLFAAIGPNATAAGGSSVPPLLAQGVTATGAGGRLIICDNTATTAVQVSCVYTFAASAGWGGVGVELQGGATGGGGATGVTSFNTRTGVVVPATGDYTVAQVTGAAPISSPTFTTAAHAPTPIPTSNDTSIATTAFVKTALGGGGGTPVPIGPSAPTMPICQAFDAGIGSTGVTVTGLDIRAGDTVVVGIVVNNQQTATTTFTSTVTDNGGSTYTQQEAKVQINSTSTFQLVSALSATAPGGAVANATSVTVTANLGGKAIVCVNTYVGVHSFGVTNNSGTTSGGANGVALTVGADSHTVAMLAIANVSTVTPNVGTLLRSLSTTTGSPASAGMCGNTTATAGSLTCSVNFSASATVSGVALELVPGVTTPGTSPYPKVVNAVPELFLTPTTKTGNICPTSICNASGIYRLNHYVSLTAACPGGTLQLTLHYTSIDGARTVTLLSTPLDLSSATNVAGGSQRIFQNTGAVPVTYDITYPAACSSSSASGSVIFILEQLQ